MYICNRLLCIVVLDGRSLEFLKVSSGFDTGLFLL